MITKMHIENFKCFKEFDVELGPFNVLIGPNGCGKSSLFQAIYLAVGTAVSWEPIHPNDIEALGLGFGPHLLWKQDFPSRFYIGMEVCTIGEDKYIRVLVEGSGKGLVAGEYGEDLGHPKIVGELSTEKQRKVTKALTDLRPLDLYPAALKEPSVLPQNPFDLSRTGKGLPSLLNSVLAQDREAFQEMEDTFCAAFPEYTRVLFKPRTIPKEDSVGNAIVFRGANGREFPSESVSDGAVRYLAYLALRFIPDPPRILLVEEPENGVHFQRLQEIVGILRKLQKEKGTQVIMTTHSPYLLDLVEPKEVLVFEKDPEGAAHCKRLSEFGDVEKLKKHFMTGEIWTEFTEKQIVFGEDKDAGK